jgi:hypothetical protein
MGVNVPDDVQAAIGKTSSIVTAVSTIMTSPDLGGYISGGAGAGGGNTFFNSLMCPIDSECYKNKQNTLLKKILDDNQKIATNIPLELSQAEKNYYVYNGGLRGGEQVYEKLIIDRFAATADEFKKNSINKQQQFMAELIQSIKQYQSGLIFQSQMANLLKLRQSEQDDIKKNINYYQKILNTSERKVVYENKNSDTLYMYRRVMIFLYYAGLVCFIIFGNFIPDKLYAKWSVWLILIIVAAIPIILNTIIMWIFIIYDTASYWFSELPYKDVYNNLGNPADELPPPPPPKPTGLPLA